MPQVYQSSSGDGEPGQTRFLAVTGPGTMFEGTEGQSFTSVRDGTSMTGVVVEAAPDQSVPWTKPDDLDIANDEALQMLLSSAENGLQVLFVDGSVKPVRPAIGLESLRNLFTIADGNVVEIE